MTKKPPTRALPTRATPATSAATGPAGSSRTSPSSANLQVPPPIKYQALCTCGHRWWPRGSRVRRCPVDTCGRTLGLRMVAVQQKRAA